MVEHADDPTTTLRAFIMCVRMPRISQRFYVPLTSSVAARGQANLECSESVGLNGLSGKGDAPARVSSRVDAVLLWIG